VLFGRTGLACVAWVAMILSGLPAAAQGGFFGIFENSARPGGGWFGRQRAYVPQQASPYADPSQNGSDRYGTGFGTHSYGERSTSSPSSGGGRGVAYCVRLCDGRYFPIQRHANASPVQQVVDNCTCNGKDSFGLARIDVAADPTLRQGDIVATGDNVKAALIAMQAAKERARDAAAPRPVATANANNGKRTATTAQVPPPSALPAEAPAEATDDVPVD
jgi:hypothetical protein